MKTETPKIESAIRALRQRIDALREFIAFVEPHLSKGLRTTLKENSKGLLPAFLLMNKKEPSQFPLPDELVKKMTGAFGDRVTFEETETDGKTEIVMKVAHGISERMNEALEKIERSREHQLQLYESSLVSIVSSIEVFFATILHAHFSATGLVPGAKERVFSYEELQEIGSIQEAKELLIESKIEDILRGPFKSWISFVKESMGLSMSYLESNIDVMTEACLRRNLVVHNSCIVNKIYSSRVPASVHQQCELGERIVVDKSYVSSVLNVFELNCLLIGFEYWKKLYPAAEQRGFLLTEYAFDALTAGRLSVCEGLSFFLLYDKKQSDELATIGQLNYWLSLKKQGKWESVDAEYKSADYSAKSFRFRVGLAALGSDADIFFKLAAQAKRSKEMSAEEFSRFPIFDEYRSDPRFKRLCGHGYAKGPNQSNPKRRR